MHLNADLKLTVTLLHALALAMGFGVPVAADVYHVDPSWTIPEINELMDDDPATNDHLYGSVVLGDGDVLQFATGSYVMPVGNWLKLRVGGTGSDPDTDILTIQGAGWNSTRLFGSTASGQGIWQIFSDNVVLRDFSVEDSNFGTAVTSGDYNNIRFISIRSINHQFHYSIDRQNASSPINVPSIFFDEEAFCRSIE